MKKLLLAATAMLAVVTTPVLADTFQADSASQPNGHQNVTVTLGSLTRTVSAGEVNLHQDIPAVDLLVWCLDLNDTLFTPYLYNVNVYHAGDVRPGIQALDGSQLRQIASLMLRGLTLGGADAGQDDAATQLAIWKVEYGAAFSSNASGALLNRMNLELADTQIGGSLDCPTCTLTVLTDDINAPNQAMGFATVPVPGPIAGAGLPGLLAAGLALFALAKRRRQLAI